MNIKWSILFATRDIKPFAYPKSVYNFEIIKLPKFILSMLRLLYSSTVFTDEWSKKLPTLEAKPKSVFLVAIAVSLTKLIKSFLPCIINPRFSRPYPIYSLTNPNAPNLYRK